MKARIIQARTIMDRCDGKQCLHEGLMRWREYGNACMAQSSDGSLWMCTRPKGHSGKHIGCSGHVGKFSHNGKIWS